MPPAHELVRSARRRAGLTQASLASRLGMPQSVVARLERPGSNPTWSTLSAVLAATGHGLELKRQRSSPPVPLDLGQLRELQKLSPAERLHVFQESKRNIDRLVGRAHRLDA